MPNRCNTRSVEAPQIVAPVDVGLVAARAATSAYHRLIISPLTLHATVLYRQSVPSHSAHTFASRLRRRDLDDTPFKTILFESEGRVRPYPMVDMRPSRLPVLTQIRGGALLIVD